MLWPVHSFADDDDVEYTVQVTPLAPNLGTVVSAPSGATVFRVNPSTGVVTKVSGSGTRLSTHTTRALVSIKCEDDDRRSDNCDNHRVNVRIGAVGSPLGRAGSLTNFKVQMSTAQLYSSATGSSPINFVLKPIDEGNTVTFYVGMDFPVLGEDSAWGSGYAATGFYVYADRNPRTPSDGDIGLAIVRTNRQIAVAATSHLNFGTIVRPISGTSVVSVDAGSGVRNITGSAKGMTSPATSSAEYLVTGEDQQSLQVSIPSTVTLSGPQSLTVTTTDNLPSSPALNSSGEFRFRVGGSFHVGNTTKIGSYTGSIPVTVNYD